MIGLIVFYLFGVAGCAMLGGIGYAVYSDGGHSKVDEADRKACARLFMYSPLWPLLAAEGLRKMITRMRKDLS